MNPYGQQLPPGLLALIQQAMQQRQLQQPMGQQPQMPQQMANQPMGQQGGQVNPAMQANPILAQLQQRIMQQKMMGGGLNGMSGGYPTQMPTTGGAGSAGF
jgi:hypothetical protein